MTTNSNIWDNIEELTSKFDWNSVCSNQNNTILNSDSSTSLSGSSLAVQISKRSKESDSRYNNKTRASYSCKFEKALVTISEKHNGEF